MLSKHAARMVRSARGIGSFVWTSVGQGPEWRLEVKRLSVDGGPQDRLALELSCPVRFWGSPTLKLFLSPGSLLLASMVAPV